MFVLIFDNKGKVSRHWRGCCSMKKKYHYKKVVLLWIKTNDIFYFFSYICLVKCSVSFRAYGMLESLILVMKVSFVVHFSLSCHGNKNLIFNSI